MNRFLSVDDVKRIHDEVSYAPLIDENKLAGAVLRCQATYYGVFLHPSLYEQASILMHGICQAHGFLDGNKRTAWISMVTFVELNGLVIGGISTQAAVDHIKLVAEGLVSVKDSARLIYRSTLA